MRIKSYVWSWHIINMVWLLPLMKECPQLGGLANRNPGGHGFQKLGRTSGALPSCNIQASAGQAESAFFHKTSKQPIPCESSQQIQVSSGQSVVKYCIPWSFIKSLQCTGLFQVFTFGNARMWAAVGSCWGASKMSEAAGVSRLWPHTKRKPDDNPFANRWLT